MDLDPLWALWGQPIPCMYLPTNTTAAKARLISAVGALVDCSDVLLALSLQCWSLGVCVIPWFVQL